MLISLLILSFVLYRLFIINRSDKSKPTSQKRVNVLTRCNVLITGALVLIHVNVGANALKLTVLSKLIQEDLFSNLSSGFWQTCNDSMTISRINVIGFYKYYKLSYHIMNKDRFLIYLCFSQFVCYQQISNNLS